MRRGEPKRFIPLAHLSQLLQAEVNPAHPTNHVGGPNRENYKKIKKNMFFICFS